MSRWSRPHKGPGISSRGERAFTLVELLVVIAIIGILIALLLPAVQAAREAARRAQCVNHVKQLTLAMHNYHATHNQFPSGQYIYIDSHLPDNWPRHSWFYSILPYVEQQGIYDTYTEHLQHPTGRHSYTLLPEEVKNSIVPTFICPSDPANPKIQNGSHAQNKQGFHGNYVLNGGNTYFNQGGITQSTDLNGLFHVFSKTSLRDIQDGTSSTLFAGELILVPDGPVGSYQEDIRGRYHNVRHAGALFSTLYPPNTSQPDRFNHCLNKLRAAPCTATGTDVIVSARSYHPGGVVASMADGSTHFLSDDIDMQVYRALGTRAGGEVAAGGYD
ncbi:MAG: DUF1559 domain-containing protein [Planctomycetota bacterium]|nr:DUF1559 domain-containing protein [Planctomycetota bacterium]